VVRLPRFEFLDKIWRPRTELGRRIKHKLIYGTEPPAERLGRRFKGLIP